ncbi:hypothetical protein SDC9_68837 [bioreactor metagenome]|uniref:Uncharacterized protein n=1 Tax=bioreactor metagenome TaxID=1076179 RepID=A0A644Y1J4_9ZZZZ
MHLAQHGLGLVAHGLDHLLAVRAAFVADGDDGGLVEHNALVTGEDQGVGSAQIDGEVGGEVPTESSEHSRILSGTAGTSACRRQEIWGRFWPFSHNDQQCEGNCGKAGIIPHHL